MPVNAEKYFMTHRGNRTHDLDGHRIQIVKPKWRTFELVSQFEFYDPR